MGDPWGIVVVPTEEGRALLHPGAPVYSIRDMLHGWVVEAAHGNACVHALTDGDGHVHCMERGVWALKLQWAGALVPEGWDRAERVWVDAYPRRCRESHTDPDASEVALLAEALESDGLGRVVVLDLVDGVVRERAT